MTDPTRHILVLQALKGVAGRLVAATADLPEAAADWRAQPDAWTVREIVAHLANAEPPFLARLRRMVEEANPAIQSFGPEQARPEPWDALPVLIKAFEE